MESQPQNPELRINPEDFHPCDVHLYIYLVFIWKISYNFLSHAQS